MCPSKIVFQMYNFYLEHERLDQSYVVADRKCLYVEYTHYYSRIIVAKPIESLFTSQGLKGGYEFWKGYEIDKHFEYDNK